MLHVLFIESLRTFHFLIFNRIGEAFRKIILSKDLANHWFDEFYRELRFAFYKETSMDSKLGLRFNSKMNQQPEYLTANFVESVKQTKQIGVSRLSEYFL